MNKIKANDQVVVTAGRDKGKQGKVLKLFNGQNKILVEGINLVTKHVKPNPHKNVQGGISKQEARIHVSNVAIVNPATNEKDKVKIVTLKDGKKSRVFKTNNEPVDV